MSARLEALEASRAAGDEAVRERLAALADRVVRVRDELAADVAKSEDALLRALQGDERTVDADDERERPRLPGGPGADAG